MPPKSPPPEQPELFRSSLANLVDPRHPLVRLAALIDWQHFAAAFGPLYRDGVGRPGLPTRLMVGLHLLKQMDGLSDDAICTRYLDSPYVQLGIVTLSGDWARLGLRLSSRSLTLPCGRRSPVA